MTHPTLPAPRLPPALLVAALVLLATGCGPGGEAGSTSDEASQAASAEATRAGADTDATPDDPTAQPQTTSLLGEPLYARPDSSGQVAEADRALAGAPDDVELLLEAGRVRRHVWQYRQAMELYTRALERAPDDWRPWRFRGHRHISLRDFDAAIADLEVARDRAPLNWDVSYHLGLAYYLSGRFQEAVDEYLRCMGLASAPAAGEADADDFRSCSQNLDDPESRVAMTEWAVRAAVRAGRDSTARQLLADLPSDLPVEENLAYYHDLLFYKGEKTAEELLEPGPDAPYRRETVGYGVANWWLARGDTAAAVELLEELAAHPHWPGFGRIAAEADLARLRGG